MPEQAQQKTDLNKTSVPESWEQQGGGTQAGGSAGAMDAGLTSLGGLQDNGSWFGNRYISVRSNGTIRLGEAYGNDGANILTIIKRDTEGITGDGLALVDLSTDTTSTMSLYSTGTGNSNKSAFNIDIDTTNLNAGTRVIHDGGTLNTNIYAEATSNATANSNLFAGVSYLTSGNIFYGEHDSSSATSPTFVAIENGTGVAYYADKNNSGSVIEIDQDANNANDCIGLNMNIANAGAGSEFAFSFNGSEYDGTAGGSTQTERIKIKVNENTRYIYCYSD